MGTAQPLTIPEAAAALRCSERTVRRAIKRGEIPAVLFGGRYLIVPENLPTALAPTEPPPRQSYRPSGSAGRVVAEIEAARRAS